MKNNKKFYYNNFIFIQFYLLFLFIITYYNILYHYK